MTNENSPSHPPAASDADILQLIVRACQYSYVGLRQAEPVAAVQCQTSYRVWVERLYTALGTDLERMAQLLVPGYQQYWHVLVLNWFTSIVNALPALPIDEESDLRTQLLRVAFAGRPDAQWPVPAADTQLLSAGLPLVTDVLAPATAQANTQDLVSEQPAPDGAQAKRRPSAGLRSAPANGQSLGSWALSTIHQRARPVVDRIMHDLQEYERLFQERMREEMLPGCQCGSV